MPNGGPNDGKGAGVHRQPAVSHMLSGRSYGLTTTEVWAIEMLADVPRGWIYRMVRYVLPESLEEVVIRQPGMTPEVFAALVAAFRALESRASGVREFEQMEEESFDRFWGGDRGPRHTP